MTVNELRTLVDNLHEYIHIPGGIDRLKKMVLHLAVSGQLVPQDASEGTGEELYEKIQDEKTQIANQGRMKQQKILSEITDNEAPFTIPPNWKWVRLGDLYSTTTGLTYKKDQLDIVSASMIRVMRGGNIFEMEYRYKHDDVFISSEYVKDGLFLRKNQLITPAVTSIEHIGKIARIEDNLTDTVVGGFVLTLSPWCWDDNISKYALLYFNTSTHRERCRLITNKSGQAFYNLSREKLLQLPVSLPPLQEQERIVAKVDNIFALIDQLSEVYKSEQNERSKLVASSLAQLAKGEVGANDSLALTHISEIIRTKADAKVLRQTILHLAMSGQLVPQDPSEGTGEELYQQIQAEKAELTTQGKLKKQKTLPEISSEEILFQVPTSWKWVRLAESYDVRDGTHDTPKYTTTGYPLITSKNLSTGKLDFSNVKYISRSDYVAINERSDVKRNDILFAMIGSIGNPVIVDTDTEFSIKNVALFKPYSKEAYSKDWLLNYLLIASEDMKSRSSGAVQSFVSLGFLRSYPIPLPPLAEQKRIVTKTTQLLNLVAQLEAHLEK